jgi:selenide, water dikinase
MKNEIKPVRMTEYSHGAGCGCKISPKDLDSVLKSLTVIPDDKLLIGNSSKDDAAVYDQGDGNCLVFTTDFFMPVVDDAYDFGRIGAANALSDVYAMGGKPILALSVLGWPVDTLDVMEARPVLEGGRDQCAKAGVPVAGGHSIDSPEPFYGLAVIGQIRKENIKSNSGAKPGDLIYYTKSLGIGLLSTAEKHSTLLEKDKGLAAEEMLKMNTIGEKLGKLSGVTAMTDVTGFGLLGHLIEICEGSKTSAEIDYSALTFLTDLSYYVSAGALAKGLKENWNSYGTKVSELKEPVRSVLADPQTSGGLLITLSPDERSVLEKILAAEGLSDHCIPVGRITAQRAETPIVRVYGHENVPETALRFGIDAPLLNLKSAKDEGRSQVEGPMECSPPKPAKGTPGEMWKMMKSFFSDAVKYRKELRKQDTWIKRYASQKGLTVNPHWMFYTNLRLWLVESEQAFGTRFCPCFEPSDDPSLNRRMICPCDFIESDIASKDTCHCTLFGRGDLDDEGFKKAEARLMREYRVTLSHKNNMLYTADIPTDPARGLKVPDAYHLVKRSVMLDGIPQEIYMERDFEVKNIEKWAEYKKLRAVSEISGKGFKVTLSK